MMTTTAETSETQNPTTTNGIRRLSLLIIGANGCIGQAIIQAAARHEPVSPLIHAFVRTPESILAPYRFLCSSILQGDSRSPYELANAIDQVRADHIILCVGNNSDDMNEDMDWDVREASAISLTCALRDTERHTYIRVTVFSISSFSILRPFMSDDVLDQRRQEDTLISSFLGWECLDHLLIVRMKRGVLVDDTKKRNQIHEFEISNFRGRASKIAFCPLRSVHRDDLAQWLIHRISGPRNKFGGIIGITASKVIV